jgi:hypothetical protein
MYVLPTSKPSFTGIHFVFAPAFKKEEYENEIKQYIEKLGIEL